MTARSERGPPCQMCRNPRIVHITMDISILFSMISLAKQLTDLDHEVVIVPPSLRYSNGFTSD
jgi:hypothetical protein